MGFFRRLLGLEQDAPWDGRCHASEFGFDLQVPERWRRTRLVPAFRATGGRLALASPDGALFNVSCGPLDLGTSPDKVVRAEQARDFLVRAVPGALPPGLRDVLSPVSGLTNTARAEVATPGGFHGLISLLHEGMEFTIQYKGNERTRADIEMLITYFHVPGTDGRPPERFLDFRAAVSGLDSPDEGERGRARDLLVQAGSDSLPAVLASVNACNQAIMTAMRNGYPLVEARIAALRRRIELLGIIGDEKGIPAILNAIGDSAKAQESSPEARGLLSASQKALTGLGRKAARAIADVMDERDANVRLALAQVLEKIEGSESREILRTVEDDTDRGVRDIARRAEDVFDFEIRKERDGQGGRDDS